MEDFLRQRSCDDRRWGARNARSRFFGESRGNYIDAGNKLVALLGANDLIVVDTPDALLVADRKRAQQVGEIVKLLEHNRRDGLL